MCEKKNVSDPIDFMEQGTSGFILVESEVYSHNRLRGAQYGPLWSKLLFLLVFHDIIFYSIFLKILFIWVITLVR